MLSSKRCSSWSGKRDPRLPWRAGYAADGWAAEIRANHFRDTGHALRSPLPASRLLPAFSKDAILVAAHTHAAWMFWVGAITAGITAFYVWRAVFMTFFGEYRGHGHPHESPISMTGPLMILAVLSIVGGFLFNVPEILGKHVPS